MPSASELSTRARSRAPQTSLRRIAIVPAHNEEGAIAGVVREIQAFDPGLEVVVVDDGSVDRTAVRAAAAGAHVVRLPFNLGIGGAVQTGFRYALEHGFQLAVRLDGDGQHDPQELPRLLEPLLAGGGRTPWRPPPPPRATAITAPPSRAASASASSPASSRCSSASASPTPPR